MSQHDESSAPVAGSAADPIADVSPRATEPVDGAAAGSESGSTNGSEGGSAAPPAADPAEGASTDLVPGRGALPATLSRLAEPDVGAAERGRLLGRVVAAAGRGGLRALRGPGAVVGWVLETLVEVAPHLAVRDLETLRRHHDGKDGDALAAALIRNASRVTAAIGGAGGGLAAVEWAAPPALLTAPVLIAAETVAVVAVEVKLLGELHEVYGSPITGTPAERATALLTAWAGRRGVNLLHVGRGITTSILGTGMRKELRDRLVARMGRNLTTLGPFLTGAVIAGVLNRRATQVLGEQVRADLARMVVRGEIARAAGLGAPPPRALDG